MTTRNDIERVLWKACDSFRGKIDSSRYKDYILSMLFVKYLSDVTLERRALYMEQYDGDERRVERAMSRERFSLDRESTFDYLHENRTDTEIGQKINVALSHIEDHNSGKLRNVFRAIDFNSQVDFGDVKEKNATLRNLLEDFHDLDLRPGQLGSADIIGDAYEYMIANFASDAGKKGGEFFTPACVVKTLVEFLKPYNGRVYDPACGSGGMFVQSAKFVENHQGNIQNISVYGQDSNPTTWKMAQMNLAIRGIEANLGNYNADTFFNDCHPTLKADFVMANPPFNLSDWGADRLKDDVRWKYGVPPSGNANFAWLQHMIHHLAPNGKIGMVLANGSLSSQSGGEGEIRKNIIEDDLVSCIVAMPTQLFYTTQIPVSLWFLSRNKKQKGKTCFIDARKMGTMVSRKLRMLTDADIQELAKTFDAYENGTLEDVKGFCAVATTAQIAEQDYILTPGRYVGIEEQEDDGEPFDEKMERLTTELSALFAKSHDLENEIKKNLKAIGFEVE